MLNTIFNLTRPLFILDTETTGLDVKNDRIVEVGFQEWTSEGMVKEWRTLVNPGVPIPPAVTKIHGITDEMVRGCRTCGRPADDENHTDDSFGEYHEFKPWPFFAQIAPNLAVGLSNCDFGGQHVRFDLQIAASEMVRAKVLWSYAGARIVDSRQLEQIAVPRHLGDLHKKYVGHKHDGAHGALSDCRAAATVIFHQLQTYPELPRDLDVLHATQWPGMIDPDGKFAFVDGVACFGRWGKYAGKPMRVADAGYWDFILKNDFSPEAKALAADAKLGKFPEQK